MRVLGITRIEVESRPLSGPFLMLRNSSYKGNLMKKMKVSSRGNAKSVGSAAASKSERHDGRASADLRPLSLQRHFTCQAGGSVLACFGNTRVLCTAMLERDLPPWLKAKGPGGGGW